MEIQTLADPRGEYHTIGAPATANLASALQAVGLEAIMQSEVDQAVKSAALDSLNQMMLITAWGQYLDVQNCADEDACWRLVQAKSSPFFGVALQFAVGPSATAWINSLVAIKEQ